MQLRMRIADQKAIAKVRWNGWSADDAADADVPASGFLGRAADTAEHYLGRAKQFVEEHPHLSSAAAGAAAEYLLPLLIE